MRFNEYDWQDIKPVNIAPSEITLAEIAYTEEYKAVMGLFMAVFAKNEKSDRALALTSACIELNPAHYSVWDYRFDILQTLKADEDPEWLSDITLDNPKNYQIWNYRQHLISETKEFFRNEFAVASVVLGDDPKNFHAWSHLRWVAQHAKETGNAFDIKELLKFNEELLKRDVYNNSAWSFRYFVIYSLYPGHVVPKDDLAFTDEKIALAPENESSWNYLMGIQTEPSSVIEVARKFSSARALETLASYTKDPSESLGLYKQLKIIEPFRSGLWDYKIKKLDI